MSCPDQRLDVPFVNRKVGTAGKPVLAPIAADEAIGRATVNRYREVILASFNYALRPENRRRWGLVENPALAHRSAESIHRAASRSSLSSRWRRSPALAWRIGRQYDTPAVESALRAQDAQFGELVRIAACTGLRRGELVALRWGDVRPL